MKTFRVRGEGLTLADNDLRARDLRPVAVVDPHWPDDRPFTTSRRRGGWPAIRPVGSAEYVVAASTDRVERIAVIVDDVPTASTSVGLFFRQSHRLLSASDNISALLQAQIGRTVKIAIDPGAGRVVAVLEQDGQVPPSRSTVPLTSDWQWLTAAAREGSAPLLNRPRWRYLHRALQRQPHIPFAFVSDGCWARAHAMSELLVSHFNVPSDHIYKIWVDSALQLETLSALTELSPRCGVTWGWHVALYVVGLDNEDLVIDPSLFDEPVDAQVWLGKLQVSRGDHRVQYSTRDRYRFPDSPDDAADLAAHLDHYRDALAVQIFNDGPLPYRCA